MLPRISWRAAAVWVAAAVLVSLLGCGGKSPRVVSPALQPETGPNEAVPAAGEIRILPEVFELDNEITAEGTTEGSDVTSFGISALENQQTYTNGESACNAEAVSGALALRALKQGEYACAIVGQVLGAELKPIQVQVQMETCSYGNGDDTDLPLRYWIGMADFTYGSWRWFGPFKENHVAVTVNSESLRSRVKSGANNAYVCVLTGIGSSSIEAPAEGTTADFPLEFASPESPSNVVVPVGVAVRAVVTTLGEGLDTLPAQVTGLTASADESAVHLNWQTVQDSELNAIEVLRDDPDDEEEPVELGEVTPTTTEYDDETGVPGKEYKYSVRSGNEVGVGADATATIGRFLTAPGAKASNTVPDRVAVSWRASEGAVGYRVFRAGSSEGTPESVGEVAPDKFGWDDSTAETGKAYWYWVQALGEDSDSALGQPDSGVRQETGERVWWMYGRNEKHNRRSPFVGPQHGVIKWKLTLPAESQTETVLNDDNILFNGTAATPWNGNLYAIKPEGVIDWEYESGAMASAVAVAPDGTVYVADVWGKLRALNPSGQEMWTLNAGTCFLYGHCPAIGSDGTVYIVGMGLGGPYKLYAIDPSSGEPFWEFGAYGLAGTPAIGDDGTIYVGDGQADMLRAITPNGELKWECDLPGWSVGTAIIGDHGTIYAVIDDGLVAVEDEGTRARIKWEFTGVSGCPAVTPDGVLYATGGGSLLAIRDDGASGTLLWSRDISHGLSYGFAGEPAIGGDGTVYVCRDRYVYAFAPNGQLLWTCAVGEAVNAGPSIGRDGTLYVPCMDENIYAIGEGQNATPQALLSARPLEGYAPLTVDFDGSGSYDPDGSVVEYRWSWDESRWYWDYFFSSRQDPRISHEFESGGEYRCIMQAIDDQGAIGETSVDVLVHGWGNRTVDDRNCTAGWDYSLAVITGRPAIAYNNRANGGLLFSRAQDPHGGRWPEPVSVYGGSAVGISEYTSLELVDGHPAIAFYASGTGDLMYVRATDALGTAWEAPLAVAEEGDAGAFARLAVVDGNPAILYCDLTNDRLMYVRAEDSSGETWNTPIVVEPHFSRFYQNYLPLVVVNGAPATAYFDSSTYDLVFVRALDSHGASWAAPAVVDSLQLAGGGISMAMVEGLPAISYDADIDHRHVVRFIRAMDAEGTSWGSPIVLDNGGSFSYCPALSVIGGKPAIVYYETGADTLKYAISSDSLGGHWSPPSIVADMEELRGYPSLWEVDGSAAIAYFESDYWRLMYAYLY